MRRRNWLIQSRSPIAYDADWTTLKQVIHKDQIYHLSTTIDTDQPGEYGTNYIPVGDLEFVAEWLWKNYKKKMIPIEVPEVLRKKEFLHRQYYVTDREHLPYHSAGKWFVKNADKLKEFNSCLYEGAVPSISTILPGNYVVSEWIHIISEFRVFVYKDTVQAVQPYAGAPLVFPDPKTILAMVEEYKKDPKRPKAYTMDIAVMRDKMDETLHTVIMEVHPFVSCGLYGFESMDIPDMLEDGVKYYIAA